MSEPPGRFDVQISLEFDQRISELLPSEASGKHELPSQHQFANEFVPLIVATFEIFFEEFHSLVPSRPDLRFQDFEHLGGLDLVRVYGHRHYTMADGEPDLVMLYDLQIWPELETYEGDDLN